MEIPRTGRKKKKMIKYCTYQNCNTEYFGLALSKYCDNHSNPKNRKRVKLIHNYPGSRKIDNRFEETTKVYFTCGLEGCCTEFSVDLQPKTHLVPDFCPEHRAEYRRKRFKRSLAA